MVDPEQDWNGAGYVLRHDYLDGRETTDLYPTWAVDDADGNKLELDSPREFVHTLSTMINTFAQNGFVILRASEQTGDGREAAPGSWFHYIRVAPPYLTLWARYQPDIFSV
jgi:hypothetical protein